jgi:hypothetical protein
MEKSADCPNLARFDRNIAAQGIRRVLAASIVDAGPVPPQSTRCRDAAACMGMAH